MKKITFITGICLLILLSTCVSFAEEGQENRITGNNRCSICSANSLNNRLRNKTKANSQCFSCNRKPCSATRATWIQLYRKITGMIHNQKLPTTNKENSK